MIQPAPIYPPNHSVTEADGSTTLVRYHFEHSPRPLTLDQWHAEANVRRILAEYGPHTRRRLFDATLHTPNAFDVALDMLCVCGVVMCRDGEWRLAS